MQQFSSRVNLCVFQGEVNIPGEKKGAIFYEPDSGDDWDDDDPDDDLDF